MLLTACRDVPLASRSYLHRTMRIASLISDNWSEEKEGRWCRISQINCSFMGYPPFFEDMIPDLGVIGELSNDLKGFAPIIDSTGRITGYKTQAGADTVFPFSSVIKGESTFNSSSAFTIANVPFEPQIVLWYEKSTPARKGVFLNYGSVSFRLVGLFFQIDYDTSSIFYEGSSYMDYNVASKVLTLKSPSGYSASQKVMYAVFL